MRKLRLIPKDQLTLDLVVEILAEMLKNHTSTGEITAPITQVNSDNDSPDTQPLVEEQPLSESFDSSSNEHKKSTENQTNGSEVAVHQASDDPHSSR
ncbi:MAG: hypothetical protein KDJ97_30095 [Anaerolineae bacterium]|nr:hypothetical protein [Anaerolineae bacterium]